MLCVPVWVLRKGVKIGGEAGGPELEYRECGCSRRADKQGFAGGGRLPGRQSRAA